MQSQNTLFTGKIIFLAIIKSWVEWIFITSIAAIVTFLLLTFGEEGIDVALRKPGAVEIIIGFEYMVARAFIIYNFADAHGRTFYWIITSVSIAIATITYLVLGSYFVFCLFFGSVALWYQITLVQHREIPSSP